MAERPGPALRPTPSSFRDPYSWVVVSADEALRVFVGPAVAEFQALRARGLDRVLSERGWALPFEECGPDVSKELTEGGLVVRHDLLPFVSYPYEWSFSMLRAAAVLHLDVLAAALDVGLILKDGSAYNVQFIGPRPVFIDWGSFTRYREGQPWYGFAQFCRMFLNPLLLSSLRGVPYHGWLRSSLEGIFPHELGLMLGWRDKLRPVVLRNVVLQSWLQRWGSSALRTGLGSAPTVSRDALTQQIASLRAAVHGLRPPPSTSGWISYEMTRSYSEEDRAAKAGFVEQAVSRLAPRMVWDLGSNLGEYSLIASRHAEHVVAFDSDPSSIDALFERVTQRGSPVLPLVLDLLNPSPDQGWAGKERLGLKSRPRPDLVLALALVHHLRIAGGVPVDHILGWLAGLANECVLEYVPKSDEKVRELLAWRDDVFEDYELGAFEQGLNKWFAVVDASRLPSGRVLYALTVRERPVG